MIIITTEGLVEVWAQTNTSLGRVVLASKDLETLQGVTASIQLAGASEDPKDTGIIDNYIENNGYWTLELDRTTFKLWLNFEAEHYLRYDKNKMHLFARDSDVKEIILKLQVRM